ncbi:MAG: DUF4328 domain-containing protein [Acidimicrobiales bacterium]
MARAGAGRGADAVPLARRHVDADLRRARLLGRGGVPEDRQRPAPPGLVDDYLAGTASVGDLTAADDTASTLATLGLVALLLTALAFLVWRYRVQANLEQTFGFRRLEFTPGWAVGWWFVPIANLWKPKQAMNEAWVASDPSARPSAPLTARPSPLLSAWWAAWLIAAGVGRVASRLGRVTTSRPTTSSSPCRGRWPPRRRSPSPRSC